MKLFSLLIKPASADCNLRCEYCFYIDHLENGSNSPRMTDETLEIMIKTYMSTDQEGRYAFGWQGGEPTLMGLDFFKKVVEFQIKYAPPGSSISNGIQTNATLITEEMAKFFGEYKFLVGVSLDGPDYLHDYYRKTIGKKPTHALVKRGIERLKQHGVEFNILTLINNQTVKKAKEIYRYHCDNGFFFHQYIPCVEFDEDGNLKSYSINGEDWGRFLSDLFEEWIKEDVNRVSIRLFDSIMEYLVYGRYNVCYMGKSCVQYFVVEYDGSVYPCDFFVRDDLLLGNVKADSWESLLLSKKYQNFGNKKANWNKKCDSCPYLKLCHGDCQKFRFGAPNFSKELSVLCKGWKMFYSRTLPRFKSVAENFKSGHQINAPTPFKTKKIGRNEPCSCGSGKKYKYCCGNRSLH